VGKNAGEDKWEKKEQIRGEYQTGE